jgi:hypothetical protein
MPYPCPGTPCCKPCPPFLFQVKGCNGLGLPGATVTLEDAGGNVVSSGQTDSSGYYPIPQNVGTTYCADVTACGFVASRGNCFQVECGGVYALSMTSVVLGPGGVNCFAGLDPAYACCGCNTSLPSSPFALCSPYPFKRALVYTDQYGEHALPWVGQNLGQGPCPTSFWTTCFNAPAPQTFGYTNPNDCTQTVTDPAPVAVTLCPGLTQTFVAALAVNAQGQVTGLSYYYAANGQYSLSGGLGPPQGPLGLACGGTWPQPYPCQPLAGGCGRSWCGGDALYSVGVSARLTVVSLCPLMITGTWDDPGGWAFGVVPGPIRGNFTIKEG